LLDHKKIGPMQFYRLSEEVNQGVLEGFRLGIDEITQTAVSAHVRNSGDSPFLPVMDAERRASRAAAPKTIYFVSQGYPPDDTSGIARWTHACAKSLYVLGHEVHVITRSSSGSNYVDFEAGVWVHAVVDLLDDEMTYLPPVSIPSSIARRAGAVVKEIRRSKKIWGGDVVSAPIWDIEGILCTGNLGMPVITSLHTTYRLAMPFKPEWSENREYYTGHVSKVMNGEMWLLENSTGILANSGEIIKEIDAAYGNILAHRKDAVALVPHGLGEANVTNPAAPKVRAPGPLRILFVGRIEARKGPDQLLAALTQIPQAFANVEVTFVGKSPNPDDPFGRQIEALKESVHSKIPGATLQFPGYVTDEDLEAYYENADIFVAPSRFESFGLILIEAMRHGVPVVACDIGGMREIISNNIDGMLFPVDNVSDLANILHSLISDSDLRRRLGDAGRLTYESRFTAKIMAQALDRFFGGAIARERV
jgi:glycogen(starch) synthase